MKLTSLILLSFLVICCQAQQSKSIETINVKAFDEKLSKTEKAQLIDVRTPEEFNVDHIENATNINWYDHDFAERAGKYDKTKPIFVYCKAGSRSLKSAEKLSELGFQKIYNLEGGMMKWNALHNKPIGKIIGMCEEEFNGIIKSDKKVLVDFFAEWCTPCRKMAPYLIEMQEKLKEEVTVTRIDVDRNPTIAEQLQVESLPLVIIYKEGKEVWRHSGYISEEDLKKQL
jgi:thioredoxin